MFSGFSSRIVIYSLVILFGLIIRTDLFGMEEYDERIKHE